LVIAVLVYARHDAIGRLLAGTEPRIGQHRRGPAQQGRGSALARRHIRRWR